MDTCIVCSEKGGKLTKIQATGGLEEVYLRRSCSYHLDGIVNSN